MKYTHLVLLDIKQIDEEEHIKLTGQSNKNILAMARKLSDMGKPMWIRHVLVPGGSDKDGISTGLQIYPYFKNSGESRSASVPYTWCI